MDQTLQSVCDMHNINFAMFSLDSFVYNAMLFVLILLFDTFFPRFFLDLPSVAELCLTCQQMG